jgi:nucleotide-binding universal stress UspA family protein
METIVVGIDDSANARRALVWALDHAAADDEIIAVHVWHMPPVGGFEMGYLDPAPFEDGARATAKEVVADVVAERAADTDRVSIRVVAGHASEALIAAGRSADLLVLGARGHGGFASMLLGSVTTSVVNHAPCPIVVIPSAEV